MDKPHVLHNLTRDAARRRYVLRLAVRRTNSKLVAKRMRVTLLTDCAPVAIFARNAVLDFAAKIGLQIVIRPQRRRIEEEEP